MPENNEVKTIEDLTKEFEEYKKANEEKVKALEEKYNKDVEDLKSKLLDKELNTGVDVDKEEIPEEEKVLTWADIKGNIKEL